MGTDLQNNSQQFQISEEDPNWPPPWFKEAASFLVRTELLTLSNESSPDIPNTTHITENSSDTNDIDFRVDSELLIDSLKTNNTDRINLNTEVQEWYRRQTEPTFQRTDLS